MPKLFLPISGLPMFEFIKGKVVAVPPRGFTLAPNVEGDIASASVTTNSFIFDLAEKYNDACFNPATTRNFYSDILDKLVWSSVSGTFIDDTDDYTLNNFIKNFKRCLEDETKRFVIVSIAIVGAPGVAGHANVLLYDKKAKILEHFDPHGSCACGGCSSKNTHPKLAQSIYARFAALIEERFDYVPPGFIVDSEGPQAKEPLCAAWSLWYVELRLKNPDVAINTLVKRALATLNFLQIDKEKYITTYAFAIATSRRKFIEQIRSRALGR